MEYSYGIIPYYKDNSNELQFLIVQHISGHRGFPKGRKEKGETDNQAAQREFKEETGMDAIIIDGDTHFIEKYTFTHKNKTFDKKVTYFLGQIDSTVAIKLQEEEIIDYHVGKYEEIKKKVSYTESKELLTQAYNHLCTYHKSP